MGYNTTVVVLNDALDQIEKDKDFGRNLAQAVRTAAVVPDTRQDIGAGNHANAAHVVECHHADQTILVTVGGNLGSVRGRTYGWRHDDPQVQYALLRDWADKLGYDLVPRK